MSPAQLGDVSQVDTASWENKSLMWLLLRQLRPSMDLSRVVLPSCVLEPRSFLDKLSDCYSHAHLLSRCAGATHRPRPAHCAAPTAGMEGGPGGPEPLVGPGMDRVGRGAGGAAHRPGPSWGGALGPGDPWDGAPSGRGSPWPAGGMEGRVQRPEGLSEPRPPRRAALEDNAYGRIRLVLQWYLSGLSRKPKVSGPSTGPGPQGLGPAHPPALRGLPAGG